MGFETKQEENIKNDNEVIKKEEKEESSLFKYIKSVGSLLCAKNNEEFVRYVAKTKVEIPISIQQSILEERDFNVVESLILSFFWDIRSYMDKKFPEIVSLRFLTQNTNFILGTLLGLSEELNISKEFKLIAVTFNMFNDYILYALYKNGKYTYKKPLVISFPTADILSNYINNLKTIDCFEEIGGSSIVKID